MSSRTSTSSEVWVTAQCDTCGRVKIRPHEFTVLGGEAQHPTYCCTCPLCGNAIRRPATDDVITVLALAYFTEQNAVPELRHGAA